MFCKLLLGFILFGAAARASSVNATLAAFTPTDGSYVPWAAPKFHVILPYDNNDASLDPRPYNASVVWRGYIDLAFAYTTDMYILKATATTHGFFYEDALLHAKANYVAGIPWGNTNQFDGFENPTANGVFLLNSGVYTDKTTAAYNATTADVAITDQLLLGYAEPFDEVNFILSTGQTGVTVTWAYWNGSTYATLTLASDTTSDLATTGRITFTPPADWAPHVENGSKSKYWVKVTVTGGSVKPTASIITGASWMDSANARGWDAADVNRVNVGLGNLEYNPTPPAGALAKFRYQARATGTWATNATFGNFSVKNGSNEYLWGWYLVDVLRNNPTNKTANTFDDFGTVPPNLAQADMDVPASPSTGDQITSLSQWVVTELQTLTPGWAADFNLASPSFDSNIKSIVATPPVSANHETSFHSFVNAPPVDKFTNWNSGNTNNAVSQFVCVDSIHTVFDWHFGTWVYWDASDRGAMNCLSMYWLARQPNINFTYNPNGFTYNEADEYYYWSAASTTLVGTITAPSTTLSADLVPAGNWNPTAISVTSTAIFPSDGSHFWIQIGTRLFDAYITGGVLTTTQAEFDPTIASGTTVRYLGNAAGRTIEVGSTAAMVTAPPYSGIITLRIGTPGVGDIVHATIVDGSHVSITEPIANNYSNGTQINWVQVGHQAAGISVPQDRIFKWGPWFPAMGVDLGNETVGLNLNWKIGSDVISDSSICGGAKGKCGDIARRDFTNGSVFIRVGYGDDPRPTVANSPFDVATATNPICIKDGDTYPACTGPYYKQLHADGSTGPLTRSFTLAGLSGVIMLKAGGSIIEPTMVTSIDQSLGVNGGTTIAVDTTGAKSFVVSYVYYSSAPTLSDSVGGNSNTYSCVTTQHDSAIYLDMCYAPATYTGSGHTWTLAGTGIYTAILVRGFDTVATFQASNGANSGGATVSSGNAALTGEGFAISAVSTGTGGSSYLAPNFRLIGESPVVGGQSEGIMLAYQYLPAGGTVNAAWTAPGSSCSTSIITFSASKESPRADPLSAIPWPTSSLWTPEKTGIVTQRFDASTLGLGDGAAVTTWPDLSGGGFTATPASAGACSGNPTFQTAQKNGLGIVRFSGTKCLTTSYAGTGTAGVFVVGKGSGGMLAGQDSSDSGNGVRGWDLTPYTDGSTIFCRGVSSEVNGTCLFQEAITGKFANPIGTYFSLLSATAPGDVSSMYVGNKIAASRSSATAKRTLSSFVLGGTYASHALATPFTGDIGEVITTNSLTDIQRDQITNYLSTKWFLTPPQTYEFWAFHTDGSSNLVLDTMTSSDGDTWIDSPNNYFTGIAESYRVANVRDPSVALIHGTWYMVHTYGAGYFALAKSADRGLWQYLGLFGDPALVASQAPEWFIDEDGSIHVLMSGLPSFPTGCPAHIYEFHPLTSDMLTWSAGVELPADDTCFIDPYIIKIGGTYNLFGTQKHDGTSTVLLTSTSLLGPYVLAAGATTQLRDLHANEGPSVIRVNGKWRLYFDPGSGGISYTECTGNLSTCTWSAVVVTTMPNTSLHGTAIRNPSNPSGILTF